MIADIKANEVRLGLQWEVQRLLSLMNADFKGFDLCLLPFFRFSFLKRIAKANRNFEIK